MSRWQDSSRWFYDLTGLTEAVWLTRRHESLISRPDTRDMFIRHVETGRETPAGHFDVHSIESLSIPRAPGRQVPFHISTRDNSPLTLHHVDTAHLQANSAPRTLFQVASNFNCAEVARSRVPIDSGHFVTKLAVDSTQGPAAAASAGSASILRMHGCFYDPDTPPDQWGMDFTRQIELLGDERVRDHFPVTNGKLAFRAGVEAPPLPRDADGLLPHLRVGLHRNAPALYGRRHRGMMEKADPPPLIDQVFVAALNMRAPRPPAADLERITRLLLRAAYEGTYLSAIKCGSRHLVLTLVGGGSFANPISWILDAIVHAHKKWAGHPQSQLDTVSLPIYPAQGTVQGLIVSQTLAERFEGTAPVTHRQFTT